MVTTFSNTVRLWLIAACLLASILLAWRAQEVAAEIGRGRRASVLYRAGVDLSLAGRDREARAAFKQVLILAPYEVGAYGSLADAEFRLGHVDAAIHTYRRVLSIYPYMYSGDIYRDVGFMEIRARRYEDAGRDLTEAVTLNPADWHAYYLLGHVHRHLNDLPAARSAWRRVLELRPGYEPAQQQLRAIGSP